MHRFQTFPGDFKPHSESNRILKAQIPSTAIHLFIYIEREIMCIRGRSVDDGDGYAIGEEIGGKASRRKHARDIVRERLGGSGRNQARFPGYTVPCNYDSHAGPGVRGRAWHRSFEERGMEIIKKKE